MKLKDFLKYVANYEYIKYNIVKNFDEDCLFIDEKLDYDEIIKKYGENGLYNIDINTYEITITLK